MRFHKTRVWLVFSALFLITHASSADEPGSGGQKHERQLPKDAKEATDIDRDKREASADFGEAAKWVYLSSKKGQEGTWDLGQGGVEHVRFGTNIWVVRLVPDGISSNYYWAREQMSSSQIYYWGFSRNPNSSGGFQILVSTNGTLYHVWDDNGTRGQRVAPN
jgi:hypothetical protein